MALSNIFLGISEVAKIAKPIASLAGGYISGQLIENAAMQMFSTTTKMEKLVVKIGSMGLGLAASEMVGKAINRNFADAITILDSAGQSLKVIEEAKNGGASDEPEAVVSDAE